MKKTLTLFAVATLFAVQGFAAYWVVLKDGTKYKAKAKPAVTNGRALVNLDNGQSLQLDANLIDFPKSDQQTKMNLGDASVIAEAQAPPPPTKPQQPSLGSSIKLRQPPPAPAQPAPAIDVSQNTNTAPAVAPVPATGAPLSSAVLENFDRAFENVGIFEHKVTSPGANTVHAEVIADTEDKVFNAISAAAFLIVRNAGIAGAQIDMVELFMGTTTGGSSGRFRMTRADAQLLESKSMTREEYFVKKVLF
jgi:hypothetical protein